MAAEYNIEIFSPGGLKVGEVIDFWECACDHKVDEPGLLTFSVRGDHPIVPLLDDKSIVRLHRRDISNGVPWYVEFEGLIRKVGSKFTQFETVTVSVPGLLHVLDWRYILWKAGREGFSLFTETPTETIVKNLVMFNLGPYALAALGRIRDGVHPNITMELDRERGNLQTLDCAYQNLLDVTQKVIKADAGSGDMDVVTASTETPAEWLFRYYPTSRGSDRRETVLFSLENGSMAEPTLTLDHLTEATVAAVGGKGDKENRSVGVFASSDWADDNDIETWVDGRSATTDDSLYLEGAAKLYEMRFRPQLGFAVVQTPGLAYGKEYGLGDLVSSLYRDALYYQKVSGVTLSMANGDDGGAESVEVELQAVE